MPIRSHEGRGLAICPEFGIKTHSGGGGGGGLSVNPELGIIVSPVRSTYGGYYGLVVVTPRRPRPQTLHRSHDNLKNPYRIASIFYM